MHHTCRSIPYRPRPTCSWALETLAFAISWSIVALALSRIIIEISPLTSCICACMSVSEAVLPSAASSCTRVTELLERDGGAQC